MAALFYTLDYYKDGYVTVEELERYLKRKGMFTDRHEIQVSSDVGKDNRLLGYPQRYILFGQFSTRL